MAVKYYVLERKVPAGTDAGTVKYYAQMRCENRVEFDKICTQIANRSTLTKGDVEGIMNSLLTVISEVLLEGHIVQLGKLGRMRLSAGSRPANTYEEMNAHLMKTPKVVFTPGKQLRYMLEHISFSKTSPLTILDLRECDKEHV